MTEYKRNHTIPKFMLNYWKDPMVANSGVHVYDIRNQRALVSKGTGKNPYSFAIVNDLHIPIVNGSRAVSMEKWFSALEGSLSMFVRQAHARKEPITMDPKDFTKALMALVGIEHRSRYDLNMIRDAFERNDPLLHPLTLGNSTPPKRHALENLIAAATEQVKRMGAVELTIFHAPVHKSWIICDRPSVKYGRDSRAVPITNKVLLVFECSANGLTRCRYIDADEGMVDLFNNAIAMRARDWLVADSTSLLARYAAIINTNEWRKAVEEDHLEGFQIEFLTSGWAIAK